VKQELLLQKHRKNKKRGFYLLHQTQSGKWMYEKNYMWKDLRGVKGVGWRGVTENYIYFGE